MAVAAVTESEKRPLLEDLKALFDSPRELWIVFFAKFLESVGLFSLTLTYTLWLSADLGYSDVRAGFWAGAFSTVVSLITFVIGFFADSWGFRRMLILGFGTSMLARALMTIAPSRALALTGLMCLTFGTAAGIPVLTTAIRRYSTKKNRSFAFAIFYAIMNCGAIASGFLVDWARGLFKNADGTALIAKVVHLPLVGDRSVTAYSMIYAVGCFCSILAFAASLFLRKHIDTDKEEAEKEAPKAGAEAPRDEKKAPWAIAAELTKEKAFWRFMLFITLLVLVRFIFVHFHLTWPKYVTREMGEKFPLGMFYNINPFLIIFLVPIATAFTRHRGAFNCIVLGSFISAASVFFLCLGANYGTNIAMLVCLSIGEALWSPRLYEYTATIAPRGRESSYMGLVSLPMFVAKMGIGPLSGLMLTKFCPKEGPRNSEVMWLIIGLMTLVGPILIVVLRSVIEGTRGKKLPLADADKGVQAPAAA